MSDALLLRAKPPRTFVDLPLRVPMSKKEWLFHILAMITQFGGVVPLTDYLSGQTNINANLGSSTPIDTVLMAVILIVSLVMSIRYRQNIIRALPGLVPVLLFLTLCLLSAFWSDYPAISVRRTGTAVTTALWGAYLASRFSLRDIVVLIAESVAIIAVASTIAAVFFPAFGINVLLQSDPNGIAGWKGIISDKNSFGIIMATGVVTMLYLAISPGSSFRGRSFWWFGFAMCLVLLYLSQSRTSWLAGMAGMLSCFAVRVMYRRPAVGLVALAWLLLLAGPALLFVLRDLSVLTSLVGKDATLTGRVELWHVVLPYGDRRPLLGYGYGAFWIAKSAMTQEIWAILNSYKPPHAHNGWIETYLELGLVGCAVVALQFVQMIVSSARASTLGRDVDAPYMVLIIIMMLIFNMVEADLIRAPALFWPFLIIGPVALTKVMRRTDRAPIRAEFPERGDGGRPWSTSNLGLTAPPPLKSGAAMPVGRLARPLASQVR